MSPPGQLFRKNWRASAKAARSPWTSPSLYWLKAKPGTKTRYCRARVSEPRYSFVLKKCRRLGREGCSHHGFEVASRECYDRERVDYPAKQAGLG